MTFYGTVDMSHVPVVAVEKDLCEECMHPLNPTEEELEVGSKLCSCCGTPKPILRVYLQRERPTED